MCFPIDYELGQAIIKNNEAKLKAIYEACKGYVVKLISSKGGQNQGFFNGFFYSDSNIILSSGHICGFNGADKYEAVFYQGSTLEHRVELELLHVGSFVHDTTTHNGTPVKVYNPDVAVLECPNVPPHPPRPFAEHVTPGTLVCVVGFKGVEEPQLSISDGIVSYVGFDSMHITAHADDGYSGSPVLSTQGYVVGMIKGALGTTIKQVEVVSAQKIHDFLVSKGLPGFMG
jgi:S1-C subfamily serine protease